MKKHEEIKYELLKTELLLRLKDDDKKNQSSGHQQSFYKDVQK